MLDPTGHLVEFIDKNRINLGVVQVAKTSRLNVLSAADREVALSQGRVLLFTPPTAALKGPRHALVGEMRRLEDKREELAGQVDVPGLWELVHQEEEPLGLPDLAELVFPAPLTPDHFSGVLRALFNERLHFRLAGSAFVPLSQEQLEQKQIQQEREEAHRSLVDDSVAFLRDLPAQGELPEPPPELARMLADLVVLEEEAPQSKLAKEIVTLAEVGGRAQLFRLLVRLGVFQPHENLALRREGLSKSFPAAVEDEAACLAAGLDPNDGREDLTELYTFTIDGAFTTDFDDALSFEPTADGGGVLGVHITDAAELIRPGSLLDREALNRGSSLYLPDDRIPMLPPRLSEDALSLRQGELRPAFSTLARLDAAGDLVDYRLVRSRIQVKRRLTYDETDHLLESDPHLGGLYTMCEALKKKRQAAGAYFLPLPEVLVGVDEEGQVWVRRVDREGPSREMVAETAILANWLMASFLESQGVPALFRRQPPPPEAFQAGDPADIYLHFRQRRLLNPVDLSTKPGLHSSLGVEPYTHATSPIRRYLDLLMQRQLGAVLAGLPPMYSEKELKDLAQFVEPQVRRGGRVRNSRQRYWILQWLLERRGQVLPALVMEQQQRRWQLLITDVMLLTTVPLLKGLNLEPGQEIGVRIEQANPFEDILKVKVV
ncbi:MAG: RNB domain-containing ribonuclease [Deltaproteobacteria bacterium]|nr:RNB domain-containing ribonuclease [Deltaproteobacteria bacterium]